MTDTATKLSPPLPDTKVLRLDRQGTRLYVTIDDPRTRNAMSAQLVEDLEATLDATKDDRSLRTIVIQGTDGAFCAGADLKSTAGTLKTAPQAGEVDPLYASNRRGGELFARLNSHPQTMIAVVDGPAFGGGFGFTCCMDVVIATPRAKFALSETTLGLPPAQIAPYVVGRLGLRTARRLALTGVRLDGREALAVGLVDFYCESAEEVTATLTGVLNAIGRCAPGANAVTKDLILTALVTPHETFLDKAAAAFSGCLRGPEGQEGVAAFAGKRPAKWVETI